MDAAGRMGRRTRHAGRMCGLKRKALVSFAVLAGVVFVGSMFAASSGGDYRSSLTLKRTHGAQTHAHTDLAGEQHVGLKAREGALGGLKTHSGDVGNPHRQRGMSEEKKEVTDEKGKASNDGDPLTNAVTSLNLPNGALIAVTFSDSKMLSMVVNWSVHLRKVKVPHLVGALDNETREILTKNSIKNFRVFLPDELDGGSGHSSDNWKRFAMLRITNVRNLLELGYDVLMSDADVVWVNDPRGYLQCGWSDTEKTKDTLKTKTTHPCTAIAHADVMVSSDNLSPKSDAREGATYARCGVFNTGIVFLKHNANAKAFAKAWLAHLSATDKSNRFSQLTSDQQVFNAMTRKQGVWPGLELWVGGSGGDGSEQLVYPTRVLTASLGGESFDGVSTFNLGILPVATFQPGHVGFLQRVDTMEVNEFRNVYSTSSGSGDELKPSITPYCVHATYTFDGSTAAAKRLRFAEVGLWSKEADAVGTGEQSEENGNDSKRYLTYDALQSIKHANVDITKPDIGNHLLLGSVQLANLRDAIAIAKTLKRTLAIPRPTCVCDKVWGGHDNIFNFQCHYPGSANSKHVPGVCPLDHFISPSGLREQGVEFVTYAELESSMDGNSEDVVVVTSGVDSSVTSTVTKLFLPRKASEAVVKETLHALDARVIKLSNAFQSFGGFTDETSAEEFDTKIVDKGLAPQQWCSECHPQGCVNLIDKATIDKGILKLVREVHDQFCASFDKVDLVGVANGGEESSEKNENENEKKASRNTVKKSGTLLVDSDDAVGAPPLDDEIAAAGW